VRFIEAASACGASSSLPDIASSAALTRGLLDLKSLAAVKAVLAALDVAIDHPSLKAVGFDLPSLKAAGCNAAAFRAAGYDWSTIRALFSAAEAKAAGFDVLSAHAAGYNVLSLVSEYGYDTVKAAGVDVSCILVSDVRRVFVHDWITQNSGRYYDFRNFYATLHCHKVDDRTEVRDGDKPVPVPSGWRIPYVSTWPYKGDIDEESIRFCSAHPWQSSSLVIGTGQGDSECYYTAMYHDRSKIGSTRSPSKKINFSSRLKIGKRMDRGKSVSFLPYDAQGKRALYSDSDVLLLRETRIGLSANQ